MNDIQRAYESLHKNKKFFWGKRTFELRSFIEKILKFYSCETLYDFGCGKGHQYSVHKIHHNWNIKELYLYDIGVPEISKKPENKRKFDAVLSIDVMEHIEESEVSKELSELIERIVKIGFFVIDTKLALKTLPDGRNAHLTVKPCSWWNEKILSNNPEQKKIIVVYDGAKTNNFFTFCLSKEEENYFKRAYEELTSSS